MAKSNKALEAEKLAAMAEFAAGAGHEINNPLAVITGRAELLLRDETDPERRRGLALIHAQAMRVHEMIADMRLFARPPRPEIVACDLPEIVDRAIGQIVAIATLQEIVVRRLGQPEALPMEADPVQLTVAIKALCQNALDAIGRGGTVEIGVSRLGEDAVEITVSDDGPGVLAAERRHLFDPFFSARQAGRGLGMGLAKCWRIVTGHGGTITVQDRPGRGVTFVVRLPRIATPVG